MCRTLVVAFLFASCVPAQVRTLSLSEVIDLTMKQSPDVALVRLDEQKAVAAIRLAKAPFVPTIGAGSGLAYSNGIPLSIAGSAPSIIQAQATSVIFSRERSHVVSQARENARGASIDTDAKQQEVVHRAALLYLDAERAAKVAAAGRRQAESLERAAGTVRLRVAEGRELPVAAKEAELKLARARQQTEAFEAEQDYAERSLAILLGFGSEERVRARQEERTPARVPEEKELVQAALEGSSELRRMESALAAKGFEIRSVKAQRLPEIDLVAQYALLGRFNNYEDFYRKFQRHNGQLGISFRIPLFTGSTVEARSSQTEAEAAQLRIRIRTARDRIAVETRRSYDLVRRAETARQVARLDLEVARERLSILLAKMEEGRASLGEGEGECFLEDQKGIAFMDSRYAEEKTRLDLLQQTGGLVAALR